MKDKFECKFRGCNKEHTYLECARPYNGDLTWYCAEHFKVKHPDLAHLPTTIGDSDEDRDSEIE